MALDFYQLDNNIILFSLDDRQYDYLTDIFSMFTQWTGLSIDQYSDFTLTTENQQTLINIIDKYIDITDLNRDKNKTSTVLEFKGLMIFFSKSKIDLKAKGD